MLLGRCHDIMIVEKDSRELRSQSGLNEGRRSGAELNISTETKMEALIIPEWRKGSPIKCIVCLMHVPNNADAVNSVNEEKKYPGLLKKVKTRGTPCQTHLSRGYASTGLSRQAGERRG